MVKEKKYLSTSETDALQSQRPIRDRVYPVDAEFDRRISDEEIIRFDFILEKLFTTYGWDKFPALPPKIDDGCV